MFTCISRKEHSRSGDDTLYHKVLWTGETDEWQKNAVEAAWRERGERLHSSALRQHQQQDPRNEGCATENGRHGNPFTALRGDLQLADVDDGVAVSPEDTSPQQNDDPDDYEHDS